jgi:hypothetical protein
LWRRPRPKLGCGAKERRKKKEEEEEEEEEEPFILVANSVKPTKWGQNMSLLLQVLVLYPSKYDFMSVKLYNYGFRLQTFSLSLSLSLVIYL